MNDKEGYSKSLKINYSRSFSQLKHRKDKQLFAVIPNSYYY